MDQFPSALSVASDWMWRTSYLVIASPPLRAGALQETVKAPSPATTLSMDGAPGATVMVSPSETRDHRPAPALLTARTCTS